jgi:alpha-tubulin suppressor-like RCC1 family protein
LRVRFSSSEIKQHSGAISIEFKDGKDNLYHSLPTYSSNVVLSGKVVSQIKVFANYQNTCIVDELRKGRCWGDNLIGQNSSGSNITGKLGLGSTGGLILPSLGTSVVSGLAPISLGSSAIVKKFAIGKDFICALVDYPAPISKIGVVSCWGRNDKGQLGYGDVLPRFAPGLLGTSPALYAQGVDFGDGISAIDLAAGGEHACAALTNGKIKCWGSNSGGQLGTGSSPSNSIGDATGEMGQNFLVDTSSFAGAGNPLQVTAGASHSCASFSGAKTYCWGNNYAYQLGNPKDFYGRVTVGTSTEGTMSELQPVFQQQAQVVTSLSTPTVCFQNASGDVKCVGKTGPGEKTIADATNQVRGFGALLGTCFTRLSQSSPPSLAPCNTSVSASPGLANYIGKNASEVDQISFMNLDGGKSKTLVMGGQHICSLLQSGAVKCWGRADSGQLGLGADLSPKPAVSSSNTAAVTTTTLQANAFAGELIVDIAAGESHTCIVTDRNKVRCFGQSQVNALGNGSTSSVNSASTAPVVYQAL